MPKLTDWIVKLEHVDLREGQCNCEYCLEPPDVRQIVRDAINDLWPELGFLPRMYNGDIDYGGRDNNCQYYDMWSRRQGHYIMHRLRDIMRWNKDNLMGELEEFCFCVDCGMGFREGEGHQVNVVMEPEGEPEAAIICTRCWKTHYRICEDCGKFLNQRDAIPFQPEMDYVKWKKKRSTNRYLCQECYDERNFIICNYCNMPVEMDKGHNVSQLAGFEDDYQDVFIKEVDGQPVFKRIPYYAMCPHCFENFVHKCIRCGGTFLQNNMKFHQFRGEGGWMCGACQEAARIIKRYDYTTKPNFLTSKSEPTRPNVLHYGIEIEHEYIGEWVERDGKKYREHLESLERKGEKIIDWWADDSVYIKHDGSLDHGYETVSHPFTWSHYLDNRDRWTAFLLWLQEEGFDAEYFSQRRDRYTCGFHAHMSKDAFSKLHLYKFVSFFYKKSTRPLILGIAERSGSKYAKFDHADLRYAVHTAKNKRNASGIRYSAINLMGGHAHEHGVAPKECQTCEIRVFKGTLEPFIFHKNMEFLQSLFEFTAQAAPKDMVVRRYLEYLMLKPDNWRCIIDFIRYSKPINQSYKYIKDILKGA